MPTIRPVSDLRNNFADISKTVHETGEPIFLTKNGYGDMVVMSMETYEKSQFDNEIYFKLKEAEAQARTTTKRYTHDEVFQNLHEIIAEKAGTENV